jgi:hypothetical protein
MSFWRALVGDPTAHFDPTAASQYAMDGWRAIAGDPDARRRLGY